MSDPVQKPPSRQVWKHDKYNSKCVCDVCTCGLHKCPRGQSLRPKFEAQTTNQAFFDQKPLQTRPVHQQPKAVLTNYDPDVLQSSYKSQFKGETAPKSSQEADSNLPKVDRKRAPFYGETSYNSTYLPKEIQVKHYTRPQYKPKDTKFEGSSAYKEAYQGRNNMGDSARRESDLAGSSALGLGLNRKRAPFQGQSAYKQQFQEHGIDNIPRRLPAAVRAERPNNKFEGQSTYKQHFQKIEAPCHIKEECPVLTLPQIPRQASPGKQHVNYSAEKQMWQ